MKSEQNPYAKPQEPLDDPATAEEKGPRNLEVVLGAIKPLGEYRCLLTGRPASVVPVVLRRMFLFPGFAIWDTAKIALPLSRRPFLVVWQFARMFRPWATLVIPIYLMYIMGEERDRWGSPIRKIPYGTFMVLRFVAPIAIASGLWVGLGWLMNRFEFVRLLYFNRTDGLVKIRFSKPSLARRASEVLVVPNPPGP